MAEIKSSPIEIYLDGAWVTAGVLESPGQDGCSFDYLPEYVFSGKAPPPISYTLPVELGSHRMVDGPVGPHIDRSPPAFLFDLAPQGRGREYLVNALGIADGPRMLMPLLFAGAFNPIGRLRLASAVTFFERMVEAGAETSPPDGFSLEDITQRHTDFIEHIALHSMLAAGTTGVQGVAPKFLLNTDAHGRWFADLALPDSRAAEHWLVKLPRGRTEEDKMVLRNEAPYLRLAAKAGLRAHHEPQLRNNMLFVRRFDRHVVNGQLHRLHQESLASIAGLTWNSPPQSQQALVKALRSVVTHPMAETLEFLKRDVLNLAMRNTDNHARNTAVQTTVDGQVQLTPVYDFAPMFKDPEVVPRSSHWKDAKGARMTDWRLVLESLPVDDQEREQLAHGLAGFAETVGRLPELAKDCGVEADILQACRRDIDDQAERLARLAARAPAPVQRHGPKDAHRG